jgi:2'-5' RNA ligase
MRERGRPDAKSLRLFVAVELPGDVRAALEEASATLRRAGVDSGLRWVRPEGMHVTLKFLGSTDEEDLLGIMTAVREAARPHRPFELAVEGLGSFGGARNMRVVWAGVKGETEALEALAGSVESALVALGFPKESRPYSAHLTLARVREDAAPDERARIHGLLKSADVSDLQLAFRVAHCSLMESTLRQGGAVYTQLATFSLEGT